MSSFSRFQDNNRRRQVAEKHLNAEFIDRSDLSTILINTECDEITAAVVNQQEKEIAYIYTRLPQKLEIGSIWSTENLHFLISEEIFFIQKVGWHKYKALLCNLPIADGWGYYIGPEKKFITTSLKQNVVLESNQHPILVCSGEPFNINDKIMIKNRAFLIQESDNISTPGISYYSLSTTTISKQDITEDAVSISPSQQKTPQQEIISDGATFIGYNEVITLSTEKGYFKPSNNLITIVNHTKNQVQFSIPYGINYVEIVVLNGGEPTTYYYYTKE